MGIRQTFTTILELSRKDLGSVQVPSPWATHQLANVVFSDLAGVKPGLVSRLEAMKVPAIARGRALICGLARYPLTAYATATGDPAVSSPWLTSTATPQPPRQRNLWTYDDLIFHGLALWIVQRGADDRIEDAFRLQRSLWSVDPAGHVLVNNQAISAEQCLLFEGPQEGLLTLAGDTIRAALAMDKAWADRVKSPVPLVELHNEDAGFPLTPTEAKELVAEWEAQRGAGGTAYTPYGVKVIAHGQAVTDLYIQGRNALRLDVANHLSLPAALLEGSMSTASLTYSTQEGSRNDLVDLSLNYWADAVEARLSQDDVVDPGLHVAHDLTALATPTQPTRSPNQED